MQEKLPAFNLQQWLSLAGLVMLTIGALFFSWNVGLTGFLIGSILLILGCGNEKKAIAAVPWNVILMVLGVGILMNIISISGGIDIMVSALEAVMGKRTVTMIILPEMLPVRLLLRNRKQQFPNQTPCSRKLQERMSEQPYGSRPRVKNIIVFRTVDE